MQNSNTEIGRQASLLLKDENFSGSILLAHGDRIVLNESYGLADYELGVANSSNTKYRIGSITKLFTATAIMQLVEKQLLTLDSTVDRYIADYPKGNQVMIAHLLNHTSGIANLTELSDFMEWVRNPSSVLQTINRFKDRPFDFLPGERYKYSNSGYILLTYILELITDQTYIEYIRENIFIPLNMQQSGIDEEETIIKNRASGYNLKDGKLINAPYIHMGNTAGAASIYSTTEDLFLFAQAFYNDEIFKKETAKQMLQTGLGEHGHGWMIKGHGNKKIAHHGGGIHGFSANLLMEIESQKTVIILSNVFYPKEKIEAISDKLMGLFFSDI